MRNDMDASTTEANYDQSEGITGIENHKQDRSHQVQDTSDYGELDQVIETDEVEEHSRSDATSNPPNNTNTRENVVSMSSHVRPRKITQKMREL